MHHSSVCVDLLSPVRSSEELVSTVKTPERVEFEVEGLEEETEEDQWEHNMSMSMCPDEPDEDSDSDLE